MRIIVAGAGEVGSYLAKMLSREDHEIVIIDESEERLKNLAATCDLMTMCGVVTSRSFLIEAGIGETDLFIAVTSFDDANILSAILAKNLGARLTVVRIGTSETLKKETRDIYTRLGIDHIVYPEKIAAREVANTLRKTGVSTLVDFSGGSLSLLSMKIDKTTQFVNKSHRELTDFYQIEYRAVAILRNNKTIIPHGDIRFEPNDTVYLVTNQAGVRNILHYSGQKKESIIQIMIVGGSHIGQMIAKELGKGYKIKIFEANRDKAYYLSDVLDNVLLINGDGTKIDLLLEEGLQATDAFISVTGNSETNILACLLAKNEGVKHTIADIENIDYINIAGKLDINTILNKKLITADFIHRITLGDSVARIKYLTGTDAEVIEFVATPKSKITERPLKDINFPKEAIIGGVVRGKSGFIAIGDTQIQADDHVVVFAMASAIDKISKFFK